MNKRAEKKMDQPIKYIESMPLTSVATTEDGKLVIAGGGGNVLFGFPNRVLILCPKTREVSAWVDTRAVVIGAKVFGKAILVGYEDGIDVLHWDGSKLKKVLSFGEETLSAVIIKDTLYRLINTGKIIQIELPEVEDDNTTDTTTKKDTTDTATLSLDKYSLGKKDIIVGLISGINTPGVIVRRGEDFFLLRKDMPECILDGEISSYSYTQEGNLAYICQLPKDLSSITLETANGGIFRMLYHKCTCVHLLSGTGGDTKLFAGTGDGEVVRYDRGKERWVKVISSSPISSICDLNKKSLFCTTINGRLIKTSLRGPGGIAQLVAAAVVAGSAALGAFALIKWGNTYTHTR